MVLLGQCDRYGYVPPIDLDISKEIESPIARESIGREAMDKLSDVLIEVGLGRPNWHYSGGSGFHGDLIVPDGLAHPNLLGGVGALLVKACRQIGIPLLSDHKDKATRPPIVVDDTLFNRTAQARGVVWRLSGAQGSQGKKRPYYGMGKPLPMDAAKVMESIEEVKAIKKAFRKKGSSDEGRSSIDITAEISTWERVEACESCGQPRCRRGPNGQVWCYRAGSKGTGALVKGRLDTIPDDRDTVFPSVLYRQIESVASSVFGEEDIHDYFIRPCPNPFNFTRVGTHRATQAVRLQTISKHCGRWGCPGCIQRLKRKWFMDLARFVLSAENLIIFEMPVKAWKNYYKNHFKQFKKGFVRITRNDESQWILADYDGPKDAAIEPKKALKKLAQVLKSLCDKTNLTRRVSTGKAWASIEKKDFEIDDPYEWVTILKSCSPRTLAQKAHEAGIPLFLKVSWKGRSPLAICTVDVPEGTDWQKLITHDYVAHITPERAKIYREICRRKARGIPLESIPLLA